MNSLFIIILFTGGIICGKYIPINKTLITNITDISLYTLMFLIGIKGGVARNILKKIREYGWKTIAIPILSLGIVLIFSLLLSFADNSISIKESLLINSGMGYYSLSSALIEKLYSYKIGTIALIANITRELITIIFAPIIAKIFGRLALISSGGATSMDTTLPFIIKHAGSKFYLISVINGLILTLLTPIIIYIIYLIP